MRHPTKRQQVFRFVNETLNLDEYILRAVELAGLDDRSIARSTKNNPYEPWASGTLQAIKYVRSVTDLGLLESKRYVNACQDKYPEEWAE